jgi:hypothetical protein
VSYFRPDGYLPIYEALFRAAASWFSEQWNALWQATSALSLPKPKDNSSPKPNSIAAAIQAFSQSEIPPALQDDNWRREFLHLLTQTANRLRNLLHQGTIKAYYFDNNGRQALGVDFWLTSAADGVLELGTYLPFGRPNAWYEPPRPAYPLFVKESELDLLLREESGKKRPFPEAKLPELISALRKFDDLPNRKKQREAVSNLPEFERYHITDHVFRTAERQDPRQSGRRKHAGPKGEPG